MRVSDIMQTEVRSLGLEASIVAAADKMAEADVDTLLVTREGEVLGVMTGRELAQCVSQGHQPLLCFVFRHMRLDVRVAHPSMDTVEAARIMLSARQSRLPVIDGGRLAGEVCLTDIVRVSVEEQSGPAVPVR